MSDRSSSFSARHSTAYPSNMSSSVSETSTRKLAPATRDSGIFQDAPHLGNQYVEDLALQRVLSFYLPEEIAESRELAKELSREAQFATSKTVSSWIDDAESNLPSLEKGLPPQDVLDVWGRKSASVHVDKKKGPVLTTSEGWRKLGQWGGYEGVVAIGYENEYGPYSRVVQFAKQYIYSPSSALQTCPLSMTDGAARVLSQHAKPARTDLAALISNRAQPGADTVFADAFKKLISRGGPENPIPRWTSGQWMTERPGGSDVSQTETVAKYAPLSTKEMGELGLKEDDTQSLGPWVINGYKFFSSATDADMTILLAKTPGKEGLSAFYAPLKRKVMGFAAGHANEEEGFVLGEPREEWNGVSVVRLKKKLGTRPLATAELELNGMRGWLIGEEGQGIRTITTILNITRVHNSVNAVAFTRRGLAIAKAFAQVRKVNKRRTLATVPLHLRTLAHMETTHRAHTHLAFFTASLLGLSEKPGQPVSYLLPTPHAASIRTLFLLLTPLTKILTAKSSITTLAECMESLGGVGYPENPEASGVNLQRLYRDANVLSIWEGTTNVLATELVRQLLRKVPIDSSGRSQNITSFSSPATDLDAATTGVGCLEHFIKTNLGRTYELPTGPARDTLEKCKIQTWAKWQALRRRIDAASPEELTAAAREVVAGLGDVICAVLLLLDARRDGAAVEVDVVRRWVIGGVGRAGGSVGAGEDGEEGGLSSDDGGEEFDYSEEEGSEADSASEMSGSESESATGGPVRRKKVLSQQQRIAARRKRSELRWTRRADRDYLVTFGREIEKKYGRPML